MTPAARADRAEAFEHLAHRQASAACNITDPRHAAAILDLAAFDMRRAALFRGDEQ